MTTRVGILFSLDSSLFTRCKRKNWREGRSIVQLIPYLLPDLAVQGLNHGSGVFSEKIPDVAMVLNSTLLSVNEQCKALKRINLIHQ